jgi:thiol-disulfide isomerase/thioredoxin
MQYCKPDPVRSLWIAAALVLPPAAGAQDRVPHLAESGQQEFQRFLAAEPHRAFAIAPGGAWAWTADAETPEAAVRAARERCAALTPYPCILYQVDRRLAFDEREWHTLWRPYAGQAQARAAPVGQKRGERFPDLAFRDRAGRATSLSAWRGSVVVLHFWGSWCAPCRREMPDLQKAAERLAQRTDIAFVLLQVREPYSPSRAWARDRGIDLPLYDSGARDELDDRLRTRDGAQLRDREIARQFPTTYVLDKHGIVVFSHVGPIERWSEYEPFLRDVAERSGK